MLNKQFEEEQRHAGIGMTSARTRDRLIERLKQQGITSIATLEAIRNTPRHLFIEEAMAHKAYEDTALPIGFDQTISQPYTVARMTELLLEAGPLKTVLEVGTGSGYQTAVLAQLVNRIFSVERIGALHRRAALLLDQLKLHNVSLRHTDGNGGWPTSMKFDAIIVTAASTTLPKSLTNQLAKNGRLVIPVEQEGEQALCLVQRTESGFTQELIEPAHFVPMLRGVIE
ncbi:MAG: protein-L-isoaspartate(D-aspartate) O-methyltransferase [Pseudomonadales bacterium]|nr:protein-L-isoaspartate(D-aspartate) O-methyltransferase [Pseudomonadales bacterium]